MSVLEGRTGNFNLKSKNINDFFTFKVKNYYLVKDFQKVTLANLTRHSEQIQSAILMSDKTIVAHCEFYPTVRKHI